MIKFNESFDTYKILKEIADKYGTLFVMDNVGDRTLNKGMINNTLKYKSYPHYFDTYEEGQKLKSVIDALYRKFTNTSYSYNFTIPVPNNVGVGSKFIINKFSLGNSWIVTFDNEDRDGNIYYDDQVSQQGSPGVSPTNLVLLKAGFVCEITKISQDEKSIEFKVLPYD